MQRLDDKPADQWVSAAIYGKSGTGKTSFGVSSPKPLILLSERQGQVHVSQAAKRLGVPVPPVLFMESVADYRNVLRALYGSRSEPLRVIERHRDDAGNVQQTTIAELDWPETVVVDSLTDCARLVVDEIRMESPPKLGGDGLPVDSQRFWNVLFERMKNVILRFRDLPMHKLFLCLADDREVGEEPNKRRIITPDLPMRRLPDVLAAAVNTIGYTYRKQTREAGKPTQLVYGVMTAGPEHFTLKPYRPLRDNEVANFSQWVEMIRGELSGDQVPAPVPSDESAQSLGSAEAEPDESAPKPKKNKPKPTEAA